jgi:hypothetical protein
VKKIFEGIDYFFNKVIPKKFIVFSSATVLVFLGKIEGQHWFYIALAYFGVNVLSILAHKGGKNGQ